MNRGKIGQRLAALGAGAILLLFTGCAGDAGASSSAASTASTTSTTLPPVLSVKLGDLITKADVEAATGKTFDGPFLYEEDTDIRFVAPDGATVEVYMVEGTRAEFDTIMEAYGDLSDVADLGEAAKWSKATGEMMIYGKGFLFTVALRNFSTGADLPALGQTLGAGILEKLP